jgi:polar amino acid transport system substrate-binding protein
MKRINFLISAILLLMMVFGCVQTTEKETRVGVTAAPVLDGILNKGELVVGTAGNMPPLNMTTKAGEVIGFDIDLAKSIADAMGVKLKVITMPFAELLPALQERKVDLIVSGMTITPNRNIKVAFVGPYFISGKALLTKIETIASAEDVGDIDQANLTLAALKGSTSQYFAETVLSKAKLIATDDYDEAVDMVRQGKVDAMIADFPICVISVFRYPKDGLLSVVTPLTYEPLGIAVPREDYHFVNWIENFLEVLDGSGRIDEIRERWFEDASWLPELPER